MERGEWKMSEQEDTPKPISFEDAEKIYDRLCGIEDDLRQYLTFSSTRMIGKDFAEMHRVSISLQSLINQIYIAGHTGKDAK
jgi:hypothetical protein